MIKEKLEERFKTMKDSKLAFMTQFIKHPGKVGAVMPSSNELAEQMVAPIYLNKVKVIVEYGTGTGVFTKYIRDRIDLSKTTFFSFEMNEEMVKIARQNIPDVEIYQDSAEKLREYLKKHDAKHADAIVSGLPWAIFPDELQENILYETVQGLKKGGVFTSFAYVHGLILPAARRFKEKLIKYFSEVNVSPIIWKNIPPAIVYRCKK